MEMFRTPGANLIGADKNNFDEIKTLIERGTNDFLLRPDWDANMQCVDLVLTTRNPAVLAEVLFLCRKKFGARSPKVVLHTLILIEALVKNCGPPIHMAVNSDSFMKAMGKLAKQYVGKVGVESKEVADQCLDMIQAWGEGFQPYQRTFPNIIKLYQDLRRERLPFKANHDPSRAPVFAPASAPIVGLQGVPGRGAGSAGSTATMGSPGAGSITGRRPGNNGSISGGQMHGEIMESEDAFLAAALAASLADVGLTSSNNVAVSSSNSTGSQQGRAAAKSDAASTLLESLKMSVTLLCEMISTAQSILDLSQNDIIGELVLQLRDLQTGLAHHIEQELSSGSEAVGALFKINDDATLILSTYTQAIANKLSMGQVREKISEIDIQPSSADSAKSHASASSTASANNSLLDMEIFDVKPYTASTTSNYISNSSSNSANPFTDSGSSIDLLLQRQGGSGSNNKVAPFNAAAASASPSPKQPIPFLPPPGPSAASKRNSNPSGSSVVAPSPAQMGKSTIPSDPFETSSGSSIDALLMSSAPSSSFGKAIAPASPAVDPMDALLSIASRGDDDFGVAPSVAVAADPFSSAPSRNSGSAPLPTVPQQAASIKPLAPPRQSSISIAPPRQAGGVQQGASAGSVSGNPLNSAEDPFGIYN